MTSSSTSPRRTAWLRRPSEPRPPRPVPHSPLPRASPRVPSSIRFKLFSPYAAGLGGTTVFAAREAGITPKGDLARLHSIEGSGNRRALLYSRPVASLLDFRERFPILAETTYLINHSLGAMPAAAEERMVEYARSWNERGARAWEEGWWDLPVTVGDQIGRLVGAPPGSVSMHQNVTVAEAVVASCFTFDGPRRRVVYEEGNFPSVRYLYQAQERRGADILVAADDDRVVEAIDERTLLVPVTHVLFKTGEIQDVE